ncbi:hypothetical protein Aph01nite_19650 [Acrocarpospora phusangensis]|uniref:Uncharacterized protein n=1 Tax=Acrocarpospora phusangensis TaxID=1070424 RepID=A0A919QAB3_9ACTN|nr:hypothetical protein Aph01nite_19650 [Acrocarpospora phusangensis]
MPPRHDGALGYLAVTNALSFIRLLPRSDRDKEMEISVLRHQVMVLHTLREFEAFYMATGLTKVSPGGSAPPAPRAKDHPSGDHESEHPPE